MPKRNLAADQMIELHDSYSQTKAKHAPICTENCFIQKTRLFAQVESMEENGF